MSAVVSMTNRPKKVILHCSATPNGKHFTVQDIREWHLANGWSDIGYHEVIYCSGLTVQGRPHHRTGAHTKGYNGNSLGVCLIGNDKFSKQQYESLNLLYWRLYKMYGINYRRWYGHHEFTDKKTCPNLDMAMVRFMLSMNHEFMEQKHGV